MKCLSRISIRCILLTLQKTGINQAGNKNILLYFKYLERSVFYFSELNITNFFQSTSPDLLQNPFIDATCYIGVVIICEFYRINACEEIMGIELSHYNVIEIRKQLPSENMNHTIFLSLN